MGTREDQEKPLCEKVRDWLERTGHPLEFRVARVFQNNGLETRQGVYIEDPVTEDLREVDVLGIQRFCDRELQVMLSAYWVVECKSSKPISGENHRHRPWAVFTAHRETSSSQLVFRAMTSGVMSSAFKDPRMISYLGKLDAFSMPERSGFGGVEYHSEKGDRDPFYGAMQSVVARAVSYMRLLNEGKAAKQGEAGSIVFPLLVVAAPLFEVYLSTDSAQLMVREATSLRLYWGGYTPSRYRVVDIVRASSLDEFLVKQTQEIDGMLYRVSEHLKQQESQNA